MQVQIGNGNSVREKTINALLITLLVKDGCCHHVHYLVSTAL
jgi:hypothetical protein